MQTAPKFSSFKAQPTSTLQDNSNDYEASHSKHVRHSDVRRHRHRHRHSVEAQSQHSSENRHNDSERISSPISRAIPDLPGKHVADAHPGHRKWMKDLSADTHTLKYGPEKFGWKSPMYLLHTRQALGVPNADQTFSHHKTLKSLSRKEVRRLSEAGDYISPSDLAEDLDSSLYISLRSSKRRRLAQHNDLMQIDSEDESSPDEREEKDIVPCEKDPTPFIGNVALREKRERLINDTKCSPSEINAWLNLVGFQDEWVGSGLSDENFEGRERAQKLNDRAATAAKLKIEILEEALKAAGHDPMNADALLVAVMVEQEKLFSPAEYLEKLKTLAHAHPGLPLLWEKYLHCLAHDRSGTIRLEFCLDEAQYHWKNLKAGSATDSPQKAIINTFVIFTQLLLHGGQNERAIALWQAVLELQFFKPNVQWTDVEELSSKFEQFWDSECPRVGEKNATGLRNFLPSSTDKFFVEELPRRRFPSHASSPKDWATQEIRKAAALQMPGRPMDEHGDEDDPYHFILYSDVEPLVSILRMDFPPRLTINAFLHVFGLPAMAVNRREQIECEINHELYGFPAEIVMRPPHRPNHEHDRADIKASRLGQFQGLRTSTSSLFSSPQSLFSPFPWYAQVNERSRDFVLNTLEMLSLAQPDNDELAEYCIALAALTDPTRAHRFAKKSLKQRSSNLRLYNAYALFESRLGHTEASAQVCLTAIKMSESLAMPAQLDAMLLYRTWIREALKNKEYESALRRLIMIAHPLLTDSTCLDNDHLARTETKLKENLVNAVQAESFNHITTAIDCLSLLSYLSVLVSHNPCSEIPSLSLGFHIYVDAISEASVTNIPALAELTCQSACEFINHHIDAFGRAMDPTLFQSILTFLRQATARFPSNIGINAVMNILAPKTDRLRALLHSTGITEPKSTSAWAMLISKEMERGPEFGGSPIVVRKCFQDATRSESGHWCSALWVWWLEWEVKLVDESGNAVHTKSDGRRKRQRRERAGALKQAKDVWLQGWGVLPFVKDWLVVGLALLGEAFTVEEAKGFFDLMVERGVRFHLDLHKALGDAMDSS